MWGEITLIDRTFVKVIYHNDIFFALEIRSRVSEDPKTEYRRILQIPYECLKGFKFESGIITKDHKLNSSRVTLDFECNDTNMIGELDKVDCPEMFEAGRPCGSDKPVYWEEKI